MNIIRAIIRFLRALFVVDEPRDEYEGYDKESHMED